MLFFDNIKAYENSHTDVKISHYSRGTKYDWIVEVIEVYHFITLLFIHEILIFLTFDTEQQCIYRYLWMHLITYYNLTVQGHVFYLKSEQNV